VVQEELAGLGVEGDLDSMLGVARCVTTWLEVAAGGENDLEVCRDLHVGAWQSDQERLLEGSPIVAEAVDSVVERTENSCCESERVEQAPNHIAMVVDALERRLV
jgi:hypothetical protein